jgi:hypothetical protein
MLVVAVVQVMVLLLQEVMVEVVLAAEEVPVKREV